MVSIDDTNCRWVKFQRRDKTARRTSTPTKLWWNFDQIKLLLTNWSPTKEEDLRPTNTSQRKVAKETSEKLVERRETLIRITKLQCKDLASFFSFVEWRSIYKACGRNFGGKFPENLVDLQVGCLSRQVGWRSVSRQQLNRSASKFFVRLGQINWEMLLSIIKCNGWLLVRKKCW